jgi:cytoskeleton protein RodZ
MTKLTPMPVDEEGGPGRRRIHLREITGDGELPLETVGQDLRAARLRRGDDLATVSKALKIRKDHLEALEEDRIDNLPGKTYAIGFIRSYSQYLGLDPTAFVERFKQEISGRGDDHPPQPSGVIDEDEQRRLPQGWRLIAGVVVVLLAYGAWHLLSTDRNSSQTVPPPPAMSPPKQARAAAPAPVEQTATPSPAIDATGTAPGGATPSPATSAPANSSSPAAPPQQQTAMPSPAASGPQPAVAAVPGAKVYGEQNRNPRIVLRARGATHITVKGRDGTTWINRNLNAGESYNVPNAVGLILTTTNAGAVEIDLDGLAMGSAGGDMQPADNVQLDPQSIVDRFSNRRPG